MRKNVRLSFVFTSFPTLADRFFSSFQIEQKTVIQSFAKQEKNAFYYA